MATTHTYVISSVTQTGDQLYIQGTVDGVNVAVLTSVSAAGLAMASVVAFQAFIQPLLAAAVPPQSVQHPELAATFVK